MNGVYIRYDAAGADGVAQITLDRPDRLNAMDRAGFAALAGAMDRADGDAAVRAVVLAGAGEKAFCAGADIRELAALGPGTAVEASAHGQGACDRIEALGKPVIAAIRGFALGGGCEIALACTLRIASADAQIALPETMLGTIPGYGGTQRLARLVGPGRALEMILTARRVGAQEALRIGLVEEVCESDVVARAREVAAAIARNGPVAVRLAIEAVRRGLDGSLGEGLALERALFGVAAGTTDMREGMRAFIEKRKPMFEGR